MAVFAFRDPQVLLAERVDDLVSRFSLDEKAGLLCVNQEAVPRLGVAAYRHGIESAHGIVRAGKTTVFPHVPGLACTWDTELLRRIGEASATEARAYNRRNALKNGLTLRVLAVNVDPRPGPGEENRGEDPVLTGKLAAAVVQGMHGGNRRFLRAAAILRYGAPGTGGAEPGAVAMRVRLLREYYQRPFEIAVTEGGASSAAIFPDKPGTTAPGSDILKTAKRGWRMTGFAATDPGSLQSFDSLHPAGISAETLAKSIRAGTDIVAETPEESRPAIREALDRGLLGEEDLDRALRTIFGVRFRLGEFDPEAANPYTKIRTTEVCTREHSLLAREAVRKSVVLLKNEDSILPLRIPVFKDQWATRDPFPSSGGNEGTVTTQKHITRTLAVIGPLADKVCADSYSGTPPYSLSPVAGIRAFAARASGKPDGESWTGSGDIEPGSDDTGLYVRFASGRDTVVLRDKNSGTYVRLHGVQGRLRADAKKAHEAERFELDDWGWDAITLRSLERDRLVTQDGRALKANAKNIGAGESKEVLRVSGMDFETQTVHDGFAEAVEAARVCDTAVVFVGNHPLVSPPDNADRRDTGLSARHDALVKAVRAVNPRTIVVVVGSYPFALPWVHVNVPAVVYTGHGGQEFGNGLADILFGAHSPAGRLDKTWYSGPLPNMSDSMVAARGYRYSPDAPLYPFGHGLSYSHFVYGDLRVKGSPPRANVFAAAAEPHVETDEDGVALVAELDDIEDLTDEPLSVGCSITNTGNRDADEVVQVYVSIRGSKIPRPSLQLAAFKRIHLRTGASQTLEFPVDQRIFEYWDTRTENFRVETCNGDILIGASSADIRLKKSFSIS